MITEKLNKIKTIRSLSAFEIDEKKIIDFYTKNFSHRNYRLENLWKWLYRTDFFKSKKHPVVAMDGHEVIGHMGIIPFWLYLEEKKVLASWYMDMHVAPQHRGKGAARLITKELMKLTDIHFGLVGNDKSMGVFKEFGWADSYKGYLHHFLIQPMNHPKFAKFSKYFKWVYFVINFLFKNIFCKYYILKKSNNNILKSESLNKENIKIFIDAKENQKLIKPVRDENYLYWRFLNSPEIKNYKIFKDNNNLAAIVKERKDKPNSWHLDILLINNLSDDKNIISFLAEIILWGRAKNYSYVKVYISNKKLSRRISRNLFSITINPRFFYCAKDKKIMDILKNGTYFWQLADSDFEIIL